MLTVNTCSAREYLAKFVWQQNCYKKLIIQGCCLRLAAITKQTLNYCLIVMIAANKTLHLILIQITTEQYVVDHEALITDQMHILHTLSYM